MGDEKIMKQIYFFNAYYLYYSMTIEGKILSKDR